MSIANIDFYLLTESSLVVAGRYICRLVEKCYQQQQRTYIYTDSEKFAYQLNDLLWTFNDTSFIPHNIYEENPNSMALVKIGYTKVDLKDHNDVLINLTESVPAFYKTFKQVVELIPSDELLKTAGRKKYKFYKTEGCKVEIKEQS